MLPKDEPTKDHRRLHRGKLFALLFASLLLSLVCAEFIFRGYVIYRYSAVVAEWSSKNKLYRYEADDPIAYTLHPNMEDELPMTWKPEVKWTARTNAMGFRGALPTGADEEKYRVLVLGDSYTFGWALDEGGDPPYPALIETMLNQDGEASSASLPVEVFNASVPGYNTAQEARMMERLEGDFEPDLVVVGYVMNDAEPQGTVPLHPRDYYAENVSWLWGRLMMGMEKRVRESNYDYPKGFEDESPKWRRSETALTEIAIACREKNIDLIVAIFPDFTRPFDSTYPNGIIHDSVTMWARELGAEAIDFWPEFQGKNHEDYWVKEDGHPNGAAHRVIAERLAEAIEKHRSKF